MKSDPTGHYQNFESKINYFRRSSYLTIHVFHSLVSSCSFSYCFVVVDFLCYILLLLRLSFIQLQRYVYILSLSLFSFICWSFIFISFDAYRYLFIVFTFSDTSVIPSVFTSFCRTEDDTGHTLIECLGGLARVLTHTSSHQTTTTTTRTTTESILTKGQNYE